MKAKDLIVGSCFKVSPRKRKFRWVQNIELLKKAPGRIPDRFDGKLLIICQDCSQLVLDPEADVVELGEVLKNKKE